MWNCVELDASDQVDIVLVRRVHSQSILSKTVASLTASLIAAVVNGMTIRRGRRRTRQTLSARSSISKHTGAELGVCRLSLIAIHHLRARMAPYQAPGKTDIAIRDNRRRHLRRCVIKRCSVPH